MRRARFWLALADEQEGKTEEAEEAYNSLLRTAPANAPWKQVIEARLKALKSDKPENAATEKQELRTPSSQSPSPGPTAADLVAAQNLSGEEKRAFVNSMVERLAGKLEKNPQDFNGWLRLVRAYAVLGRKEDANRALTKARENIAADTQKSRKLDALASEFGLGT